MRYAFIKQHAQEYVRRMCEVMQVHPSGYYAWKAEPLSLRAKDDQAAGFTQSAWLESGGVYGYHKITLDMRELGERCGKHRVAIAHALADGLPPQAWTARWQARSGRTKLPAAPVQSG